MITVKAYIERLIRVLRDINAKKAYIERLIQFICLAGHERWEGVFWLISAVYMYCGTRSLGRRNSTD